MSTLYKYMVQGIIDSGIKEDGGDICYNEIPKLYHVSSAIVSSLLCIFLFRKYRKTLIDQNSSQVVLPPNWADKVFAFCGIISLILTFYFKLVTHKGIFIFNPCHIALLCSVVMSLAPSTKRMKELHTCWTAWLFGAVLALAFPHLYGIIPFQVYLYYFEHLLIIPIGPIILYRRYGFLKPNFQNHVASYSTVVLYQIGVLFPLSMIAKVNLNFSLCHSPADFNYKLFGYYYFSTAIFSLGLFSYICRWIAYIQVWPLKYLHAFEKPKDQ